MCWCVGVGVSKRVFDGAGVGVKKSSIRSSLSLSFDVLVCVSVSGSVFSPKELLSEYLAEVKVSDTAKSL